MIYLSRYCKIKPQHTAPLIVSDIKKLLAPLPNRYTRGEYSVPVNTTAEQYSDSIAASGVTMVTLHWSSPVLSLSRSPKT